MADEPDNLNTHRWSSGLTR